MLAQKLLQRTARRALAGASPASTMLQRGGVRAWFSGSPDGAPQGNPPAKVRGAHTHSVESARMQGWWGGALSCSVALLRFTKRPLLLLEPFLGGTARTCIGAILVSTHNTHHAILRGILLPATTHNTRPPPQPYPSLPLLQDSQKTL